MQEAARHTTFRVDKEFKSLSIDERQEDERRRGAVEGKTGGRFVFAGDGAGSADLEVDLDADGGDGVDDEMMICCGQGGSAADNEFDEAVGALEEIIMEQDFVKVQTDFCKKHCAVFEDSEENKLEYTDVFNAYTDTIEKHLETRLTSRIPGFELDKFAHMCEKRKDEISEDVFDILLSCGDFAEFKDLMLSHKTPASLVVGAPNV